MKRSAFPVGVFIDESGRTQESLKGGLLAQVKLQETVNRIRTPPMDRRTGALY